jgi:hypothetical protein
VNAVLAAQLVAALSLALAGGLHCAGMCGGFVGALQLNRPAGVSAVRLAVGYHAGRLVSYSAAGALIGAAGAALYASDVLPLQIGLLIGGSALLLAVGAAMFGRGAWLRRLEPLGAGLWRVIAPLARRVYPPRSGRAALAAGLAWGWIPCGMVYAALPLALVTGSAWQGAAVMFAFGLGTLPAMVAVDTTVVRLHRASVARTRLSTRLRTWLRPVAGVVIVLFGLSGLAHAARVAGAQHPAIEALAAVCHS